MHDFERLTILWAKGVIGFRVNHFIKFGSKRIATKEL